jgi:hypothetical protein
MDAIFLPNIFIPWLVEYMIVYLTNTEGLLFVKIIIAMLDAIGPRRINYVFIRILGKPELFSKGNFNFAQVL